MTNPDIGTIIAGTLRPEDLIPAFANELERRSIQHKMLIEEARAIDCQARYFDAEAAEKMVAKLGDALSDVAPEGTYFGAHDGDGSDFGFWMFL